MNPIIKWPGGKRRELKKINEYIPKKFTKIIEPFFGGGAFSLSFEEKEIIANDLDADLINFYKIIKDKKFISLYKVFSKWWDNGAIPNEAPKFIPIIEKPKKSHAYSNHHLAYYSARKEYNKLKNNDIYNNERGLLFFLMRELSFSSMFRFNPRGEFNVPFGGHSYSKKNFSNKIELFNEFKNRNIKFLQNDFSIVIEEYKKNKEALIFLDPPYDSVFKDYNSNSFGQKDQIRLRDTLMNSQAKIILVINKTKFIKDLYKDNFYIYEYDKKYSVNFKNRNQQKVQHLLITNFERGE